MKSSVLSASWRVAFALALVSAPVLAQQPGITTLPDTAVARIDRAFAALGGPGAPGCAIGIAKDGQPQLTRAYGLANLEYSVPNTPETIFESGSVAKQFTAAAVVLLALDGKLSLDDDIRRWLPELPDFGKRITIRNLLTHTSGLRDQWGLLSLRGSPPGSQVHSLPLILDLVSHQKALNFDPGSEYLYSNTGYALSAIIVQRASGQSLAQFSQARLFQPLGMTSTRWRDDYTAIVKNRATAYDGNAQRGFRTDMPFTNVYGNGGLLTTVGDLLKWNTFLDTGAPLQGGQTLVKTLQTPMVLTSGRPITYALGLDVSTRNGARIVSHGGSTAGYRTWLARFPDQKVSAAVLCNVGSADPGALGLRAIEPFIPAAGTTAGRTGAADSIPLTNAERYAGLFRSPTTQNVIRTVARNGQLVTELPVASTLRPVAADRFSVPGQGDLVFRFDGPRVRDVLLVGTDTIRYEPVASASPDPARLATYAGSYWSDELETRVTVAVVDTMLVIRQRPATEIRLRPMFADAFNGPGVGTMVFSRDANGRVNGFGIWAGRVRNVRFSRER